MSALSVRTRLVAAGAGLAAVTGVLVAPAANAAAAPTTTTTSSVAAAAGWLSTQFVDATKLPHPDGDHFTDAGYPNTGLNADVIVGLAASHTGRAAIATALGYLRRNIGSYADFRDASHYGGPYDGAIGKVALAAIVAGADPQHFAGHALISRLKADECRAATCSYDGLTAVRGQAHGIYSSVSESFVLLAEARSLPRFAPSQAAVRYFLSLQCRDGGFTVGTTACGTGAADLDATSYAVMALSAVGGHPALRRKAVEWLLHQRRQGRFWVSQGSPNTDSTGLAVAALAGRGIDLSASRNWLRAQQVAAGRAGAGALRYGGRFTPTTTDATSPSVLATAQGLLGLVPGGSLATVSAAHAKRGVALFAPGAGVSARRVPAGARETITGRGFAAGERVVAHLQNHPRVRFGAAQVQPNGVVRIGFRVPRTPRGDRAITLTGASSGLSVTRTITVTRAG